MHKIAQPRSSCTTLLIVSKFKHNFYIYPYNEFNKRILVILTIELAILNSFEIREIELQMNKEYKDLERILTFSYTTHWLLFIWPSIYLLHFF